MTVVGGQARRRWGVVAAAVVGLAAVPVAISAVPAHAPALDVARIRASADHPYQGYAVSSGTAGLPALPQLSDVSDLLDGNTRMRVWYSSASRWRVDVVDLAAERDTYQTPQGQFIWDYGRNQLTEIGGTPPVRLPRGADLTPPELARRLLALAADQVTLAPLPAQRVAGLDAAGVRLTPTSPLTTVGHIDIWADPASGLPLRVEVTGRSAHRPFLTTRFLDVSLTTPAADVLVPPSARVDMNVVGTDPSDLENALNSLDLGPLPDSLAGQPRTTADVAGVAAYGSGLARFLVVPVPAHIGYQAMHRAQRGGGVRFTLPAGDAVLIATPLVSVLAMDAHPAGRTYLLAGLVDPKLLKQAAADLSNFTGEP